MNYIYDISLNFNKNNLYEFYEWKEEDDVEFILKIPIFRIEKEDFINIKYSDIIINQNFLKQLLDKTEVYNQKSVSLIRYSCVFSCDNSAIAIEFDENGNSYMKSNLSIDEEADVIECASLLKYTILDYKIKNKKNMKNDFCTRNDKESRKYVLKCLENIKLNNEESKLKYIFYEIYNEKLSDIEKIYSKLVNVAKTSDDKSIKLKNIIDITERRIMSNNT